MLIQSSVLLLLVALIFQDATEVISLIFSRHILFPPSVVVTLLQTSHYRTAWPCAMVRFLGGPGITIHLQYGHVIKLFIGLVGGDRLVIIGEGQWRCYVRGWHDEASHQLPKQHHAYYNSIINKSARVINSISISGWCLGLTIESTSYTRPRSLNRSHADYWTHKLITNTFNQAQRAPNYVGIW